MKNSKAPEMLTEIFPTRKSIIILETAQCCKAEVLKLLCMAQKLYLVWDQKYTTFSHRN